MFKICSKCKINKELTEFHKNSLSWCKLCKNIWAKNHYKKYKKEFLEYQKQYALNNPHIIKAAHARAAAYMKNRRKKEPGFKLRHYCSVRLRNAFINKQKSGSTIELLGCSIDQLKQHLETQFKPGMTWDNWGRYGWHIDHIIPLFKFDLTDKKELKKACHYTNLQPLWAKDNLTKEKS